MVELSRIVKPCLVLVELYYKLHTIDNTFLHGFGFSNDWHRPFETLHYYLAHLLTSCTTSFKFVVKFQKRIKQKHGRTKSPN